MQVAPWGVFVSVARADVSSATVEVQTEVLNQTKAARSARTQSIVLAPDGSELGRPQSSLDLSASGQQQVKQELTLKKPSLWFPETPQLSSVVTEVILDGKTVDKVTTPFGERSLAWSADTGLTLNGKAYKLSGGCIHGDKGVLGA